MKAKILLFVLFVGLTSPLLARARYFTVSEMIERADVIAVVSVVSVESAKQQGEHWIYGQKAVLETERVLKGQMDASEARLRAKEFQVYFG